MFWKALSPEGGASDVAASIIHYCKDNSISVCVVGSHGFGAMTRALRSFVGLGSVADYCLHNALCSVCVVKATKFTEADAVIGANGEAQDKSQDTGDHQHAA